jgi:TIR domain
VAGAGDQQRDFFVSYTGADRAWAEWIAWQLEDAGYSIVLQA